MTINQSHMTLFKSFQDKTDFWQITLPPQCTVFRVSAPSTHFRFHLALLNTLDVDLSSLGKTLWNPHNDYILEFNLPADSMWSLDTSAPRTATRWMSALQETNSNNRALTPWESALLVLLELSAGFNTIDHDIHCCCAWHGAGGEHPRAALQWLRL